MEHAGVSVTPTADVGLEPKTGVNGGLEVLKQTPKHPCVLWVECEQDVQAARRGTERARIDKPMELWSSLLNHRLHQSDHVSSGILNMERAKQ